MPYTANLNGLVILTSASLIIAQYLDNKQKEVVRTIKVAAQKIDYSEVENESFRNKMKTLWENIFKENPSSTHKHIITFLLLLVGYALSHILCLVGANENFLRYWLISLSVVLLIALCLMVYRLNQMREQRQTIGEDLKELMNLDDAWKKASEFYCGININNDKDNKS